MFEYILLLELCSVVYGNCLEATKYPKHFKTHKACVVTGLEVAHRMAKVLPNNTANQNKLYIRYGCMEVEKV